VRLSEILYRSKKPNEKNRAHRQLNLHLAPFSHDLTKLVTALTKDSVAKHSRSLNWSRAFLSKLGDGGSSLIARLVWASMTP